MLSMVGAQNVIKKIEKHTVRSISSGFPDGVGVQSASEKQAKLTVTFIAYGTLDGANAPSVNVAIERNQSSLCFEMLFPAVLAFDYEPLVAHLEMLCAEWVVPALLSTYLTDQSIYLRSL